MHTETITARDYQDDATQQQSVARYGRQFFDFVDGRVTSNDHFFSDHLFEYFDLWWSLFVLQYGVHESRLMREFWRQRIAAEAARLIQWGVA